MLMLRGYIDESHDSDLVPKLFTLSCIIGYDNMLPWFEMAWTNILEKKNEELAKQGRKLISRYHAADCSSLLGEFARKNGWNETEQIEFSLKLFDVFRKHPIHIHSFDIPLQLLVQEMPETSSNPIGFAYVLLLSYLMKQISEKTLGIYPNDKISLHHDQCDYDGALADTFRQIVQDKNFPRYDQYTSITPECWQNCTMLQPADMIAYENFKEGLQAYYPNPKVKGRRKSLAALLDLESISGRASSVGLDVIRELKKMVDGLDSANKELLFATAKIHHK